MYCKANKKPYFSVGLHCLKKHKSPLSYCTQETLHLTEKVPDDHIVIPTSLPYPTPLLQKITLVYWGQVKDGHKMTNFLNQN